MQSMTGYGRSRICRDGRELTLELKSVNHRFLDISIRLPKSLSFLEDELRTLIQHSGLVRGHVDAFVTYQNTRTDAQTVRIDTALLKAFNASFAEESELAELYAKPSAAEILTLSGAVTVAQAEEDVEAVTSMAREAFEEASKALLEMRLREGAHLAEDLLANLSALAEHRNAVCTLAPQVPLDYRNRLEARMNEWKLDNLEPQRIAQEVAIMADKCAIDEELSRLESHITQFENTVRHSSEAGKKLDFLLQEMNREVNTMGSKAGDTQIVQHVVDAKCVIEKLREQVQNAV